MRPGVFSRELRSEATRAAGRLEGAAGWSSTEAARPEAARSCAEEVQGPWAEEEPKEVAEQTEAQLVEDPRQKQMAGSGRAH